MGFLDPLFARCLFGIIGIIGCIHFAIPPSWLVGESIYLIGCTIILFSDWAVFSTFKHSSSSRITELVSKRSETLFLKKFYFYWIIIQVLIGISSISLGFVGDSRLSASPIKRSLDIINSFFFVGQTYQFLVVNEAFNSLKERLLISSGLLCRVLFATSKGSGMSLVLWIAQRWLNPSSRYWMFNKLLRGKIRLIPLIVIFTAISIIFTSISVVLSTSLSEAIQQVIVRSSRDFDIYYFLHNLTVDQRSTALAESGGWLGNFIGFISDSPYNFGSLVKALAINAFPNETGPNPRLHALLISSIGNNKVTIFSTVLLSIIELTVLRLTRTYYCQKSSHEGLAIFGFMASTLMLLNLHIDTSSIKYGFFSWVVGVTLLKYRFKL